MPLKLVAPRKGKSPNYTIRGHYLGIAVNTSSRANKRSVALSELKKLERAIEQGNYPPKQASARDRERTFLSAAVAYLEAGRRPRYVARLIKHFGTTPLDQIDQAAIDDAAITLLPNVSAASRNAAVYTPVSAILHHAGVAIKIRRPKGAGGRTVTDWLRPEDAAGIIAAADAFDAEFGLLLRVLLYTGLRLGEALALCWSDVDLETGTVWVRRQKGGIAGEVRLRFDLQERLAAEKAFSGTADNDLPIFRFHQGGNLKHKLLRATLSYLGLHCPTRRPLGWRPPLHRLAWVNFHTFRHTFATWWRRSGGDSQGLLATGNWRDRRSAERYAHVVAREEWQRVEKLPSVEKAWNAS
jgi:integrase